MTSPLIKQLLQPRMLHSIGLAVCLSLLATAFYMEHRLQLEPCPLCIMQRIVLALSALLFLAAVIQRPLLKGQRIYASSNGLLSIAGGALAIRHLWLQHLPADEVPACLPSLDYMFDVFPLVEVFQFMLKGTGDCADVSWTLLGLSIPAWTLVAFSGLLICNLLLLRQKMNRA